LYIFIFLNIFFYKVPTGVLAWAVQTVSTAHGQPTQNVALAALVRITYILCKQVIYFFSYKCHFIFIPFWLVRMEYTFFNTLRLLFIYLFINTIIIIIIIKQINPTLVTFPECPGSQATLSPTSLDTVNFLRNTFISLPMNNSNIVALLNGISQSHPKGIHICAFICISIFIPTCI
jgi:hypothetical protein